MKKIVITNILYIFNNICIYFRSSTPVEVPSLCRQLLQNYKNNEGEGKNNHPSDRSRKLRPRSLRERSRRECNQVFNWKSECKKCLQTMWLSKDSAPFR